MDSREAVTIKIRGQEFRIRTDGGADSLQRVAGYLNETMELVEQQTVTGQALRGRQFDHATEHTRPSEAHIVE